MNACGRGGNTGRVDVEAQARDPLRREPPPARTKRVEVAERLRVDVRAGMAAARPPRQRDMRPYAMCSQNIASAGKSQVIPTSRTVSEAI